MLKREKIGIESSSSAKKEVKVESPPRTFPNLPRTIQTLQASSHVELIWLHFQHPMRMSEREQSEISTEISCRRASGLLSCFEVLRLSIRCRRHDGKKKTRTCRLSGWNEVRQIRGNFSSLISASKAQKVGALGARVAHFRCASQMEHIFWEIKTHIPWRNRPDTVLRLKILIHYTAARLKPSAEALFSACSPLTNEKLFLRPDEFSRHIQFRDAKGAKNTAQPS